MSRLFEIWKATLEKTLGDDTWTRAQCAVGDEIMINVVLLSARDLRMARFWRFLGTTGAVFTVITMVAELTFGASWQDYTSTWDWVVGGILLFTWTMLAKNAMSSLKKDRERRAHCRLFAEFTDDFLENLIAERPDLMDEDDRTRMRSMAVDFMEYSLDPTKYDRPWWRLRDPLKGR